MVSDSRQELQNQVVHEVSKRKIIDHCRDLHGATIKHSHQYLILTMLISSSANVREREREREISSMSTYFLLFQPCQIGSRQLSFSLKSSLEMLECPLQLLKTVSIC